MSAESMEAGEEPKAALNSPRMDGAKSVNTLKSAKSTATLAVPDADKRLSATAAAAAAAAAARIDSNGSEHVPQGMRGARNTFAGEDHNAGILIGLAIDERVDEPHLISKLMAEATGTFFLVLFVGIATQSKAPYLAPIGIGMILGIMIYSFGSVSGGMFNPAVSLAVLLSGRQKVKPQVMALYIGAQYGGALVAGMMAVAITEKSFCFDFEASKPYGGSGTSLLLEIIYTGALCGIVLAAGTSTDAPNHYYGFAIGMSVTSAAYACAGWDQGSFNPAVTFGIQMANAINGAKKQTGCDAGDWLLFLLVPYGGSLLACVIFRGCRGNEYENNGHAELRHHWLVEKVMAEFWGTFFLVFTVGVAVPGGGLYAAIAIGLMLSVQIYTFGAVSGACFNPAVTLAVLLSGRGKMPAKNALCYIGAEFLGGLVGGFAAYVAVDKTFYFDYDLTRPAGGAGSSLMLEVICTCALCLAVLTTGTSKDAPNEYFGFVIGLTVTASAIACGDFDQGSFNPAVTMGINMANYANDKTENPSGGAWILFLVAPLVGSCVAAGIFIMTHLLEYVDREGNLQILVNIDPKTIGKPTDTE